MKDKNILALFLLAFVINTYVMPFIVWGLSGLESATNYLIYIGIGIPFCLSCIVAGISNVKEKYWSHQYQAKQEMLNNLPEESNFLSAERKAKISYQVASSKGEWEKWEGVYMASDTLVYLFQATIVALLMIHFLFFT